VTRAPGARRQKAQPFLRRCKIETVAVYTSQITRVRIETPRSRVVGVRRPGGLPPFQAGQYLAIGDCGQPVRKPYSIASSPAETARTGELEFLIQVVEDESPGPHLARIEAQRRLDVEGPDGSFVLPEGVRPRSVALIGGGTGIAPLRAMLADLLEREPGVRLAVLQSARTPADLCYATELRALAERGRILLVETVTRDAPAWWRGRRGRADAAAIEPLLDGPDVWCFVCGPDSLVEGVPRLLEQAGVPDNRIRTEHWSDDAATR
jgi:ferredoxin-NADP reductase